MNRPITPRWVFALGLPLIALVLLPYTACGRGEDDRREVRVMAAASLTDVFGELVDAFGATPAGADVELTLTFGGSPTLARQLEEGAGADVVAVANERTMDRIVNTVKPTAGPDIFASNTLVIATPQDNPANVANLEDLQASGILVAICAPEVPCGALTAAVTAANNVSLAPATLEPSVRSVVTKVELGEVDAGIVYRTDLAGRNLLGFPIDGPAGQTELVNLYPIAALSDAGGAFVRFVMSTGGQAILVKHGFGTPRT